MAAITVISRRRAACLACCDTAVDACSGFALCRLVLRVLSSRRERPSLVALGRQGQQRTSSAPAARPNTNSAYGHDVKQAPNGRRPPMGPPIRRCALEPASSDRDAAQGQGVAAVRPARPVSKRHVPVSSALHDDAFRPGASLSSSEPGSRVAMAHISACPIRPNTDLHPVFSFSRQPRLLLSPPPLAASSLSALSTRPSLRPALHPVCRGHDLESVVHPLAPRTTSWTIASLPSPTDRTASGPILNDKGAIHSPLSRLLGAQRQKHS